MFRSFVGAICGGLTGFAVGYVAGGMWVEATGHSLGRDLHYGMFSGTLLCGTGAMAGAICGAAADVVAYLRRAFPEAPRSPAD